jgi:hypothetical protein
MITPSPGELSGILDLFDQAVPIQFFDQLQRDLGLSVRQRVFTLPLVVWLMISQRLNPKATLSTAVQRVVQGPPHQLLPNRGSEKEP